MSNDFYDRLLSMTSRHFRQPCVAQGMSRALYAFDGRQIRPRPHWTDARCASPSGSGKQQARLPPSGSWRCRSAVTTARPRRPWNRWPSTGSTDFGRSSRRALIVERRMPASARHASLGSDLGAFDPLDPDSPRPVLLLTSQLRPGGLSPTVARRNRASADAICTRGTTRSPRAHPRGRYPMPSHRRTARSARCRTD